MWPPLQGWPIKARAGAAQSSRCADPLIQTELEQAHGVSSEEDGHSDTAQARKQTHLPRPNIPRSPTVPQYSFRPIPSQTPARTFQQQRPIPPRASHPSSATAYPYRMKPEDPGYWYRPPAPRDQAWQGAPRSDSHETRSVPSLVTQSEPVRPAPVPIVNSTSWSRNPRPNGPSWARPRDPPIRNTLLSTSDMFNRASTSGSSLDQERPCSESSAWNTESVPGLMASTASTSETSSEYMRPVSPRSTGSGPESSTTASTSSYPLKKRRTRVLMTRMQTMELNAVWLQHKFPITSDREALAKKIGLTSRQVQVWFQNQRQKYRRQMLQYGTTTEDVDGSLYDHYPLSPTHPSYASDDAGDGRPDSPSVVDRWRHENPSRESSSIPSVSDANTPFSSQTHHPRPRTPYERPSVLERLPSSSSEARPSNPPHSVHPYPGTPSDYGGEMIFQDAHYVSRARQKSSERPRYSDEYRWAAVRQETMQREREWVRQRDTLPLASSVHTSSGVTGPRPSWGTPGSRPHTNPVTRLAPLSLEATENRAGLTLPSIRTDLSPFPSGSLTGLPPSPGLTHDTPGSTYHTFREQVGGDIPTPPTPASQRLPPVLSSLLIRSSPTRDPGSTPSPHSAATVKAPQELERGRLPSLRELLN